MDKVLVKAILQSVAITILISTAIGASIGLIAQSAPIGFGVFILCTVIQFIVGGFLNTKHSQANQQMQQALLAQAAEIKIPFDLSCAYCNTVNRVPISLLVDNVFKCISCNQLNRVYTQFTTTRITQPLVNKVEPGEVNMEENTVRQTTINEPIQITK